MTKGMSLSALARKVIVIVMVFAMIISVAACAAKTDETAKLTDSAKASETTAETKGEPAKVTEIEFMTWAGENEIQGMKPMVDALEKQYPDIKLKWSPVPDGYGDKLKIRLVSGDAPSLFNVGPGAPLKNYTNQGLIECLDNYYKEDKEFDLSKYPQGLVNTCMVDGKLMMLPKDNCPFVLYYNKKIFDDAGVAYPNDKWTWNDLKDTAKKLTKDGVYGFFTRLEPYAFEATLFPRFDAPGLFNFTKADKITIDDPKNMEVYNMLQDIYVKDKSAPKPADAVGTYTDLFATGKLAMIADGTFVNPGISAKMKDEYAFEVLPMGANGKRPSFLFTSGFAVSAKTKTDKNQIWKAIKFLSFGEGNKMLASGGFGLPATAPAQYADAFYTEDIKKRSRDGAVFNMTLEDQGIHNYGPNEEAIDPLYRNFLDTLCTSTKSPEEIVNAVKPNFEKAFKPW